MHLQCQLLELGQQVVRLLAQALAILLHASRCLVELSVDRGCHLQLTLPECVQPLVGVPQRLHVDQWGSRREERRSCRCTELTRCMFPNACNGPWPWATAIVQKKESRSKEERDEEGGKGTRRE